MKNAYLFVAFLIASSSVFGKGEYQAMVTAGPIVNGKFPHFGNQVVSGAGGGTTPASKVSLRVIGRTYAKFNGTSFVPVDSYYYRYENDRGGILDNKNIDNDETLLYTESVYYKFEGNSFVNHLRRLQDYNASNRVQFLTYQQWKTSSWKEDYRYGYEYDNEGKMTTSTYQRYKDGMWSWDVPSSIQYNGQLVASMSSDDYKIGFAYDANARLVEMTDVQNIGGIWQNKEKHTYEYTLTGNNMSKHVFYEWSFPANNWVPTKNWEYTYNGNDLVSETTQDWSSSGWVNASRHEYTYDANHNMVMDIKKNWNGSAFVESSNEVWTYNGQNLPELISTNTWNGSAWYHAVNDREYRIYYQNFFPASVNKLADDDGLNIYPVPAANVLNIDMALTNARDISIVLFDVKGAAMHRSEHRAVKDVQTSIPVSELAAGTYFLRVTGEGTDIARQVVVQH